MYAHVLPHLSRNEELYYIPIVTTMLILSIWANMQLEI